MSFQLMPLPYDYAGLEPFIDAQTMMIHHDKHHAAYVNNLNAALEKHPDLMTISLDDLLKDLNAIPEDIRMAVRNHGGGTWNHNLFWEIMAPQAGGEPRGSLAEALDKTYGNFAGFKTEFEKASMGRFGSGWAWLVKKGDVLSILSTPNQDNPMSEGMVPLLTLDVWEHAYYLKYQNRRADFVSAWWNVVNWKAVEQRFST